MTRDELIAMAVTAAQAQNIDPALFCALCHHESSDWNPWSVRYEPAFYDRYIASMKLPQTEKTMRAASFGLCQIMGEVAREFGFTGIYLTELLDPAVNLPLGCRKLARCFQKSNGDQREALLLYNGGSDPTYPDKVLSHIGEYQEKP